MLILLGILLGNLCAIVVNSLAWHLRRKDLWLMMVFGLFSLAAFMGLVKLWVDYTQVSSSYGYLPPNPSPQSEMRVAAFKAEVAILGWKYIFGALVVTGIGGLLQMWQISAKWWQTVLSIWGEVGLWMVALLGGVFILGNMPELCSAFVIAFLITAAVLTFMRPLCLRWARPVWKVCQDMMSAKPQT